MQIPHTETALPKWSTLYDFTRCPFSEFNIFSKFLSNFTQILSKLNRLPAALQQWDTVLLRAQLTAQVQFCENILIINVAFENGNFVQLFGKKHTHTHTGLVDFFNQGQKTGNYFWNTVRNFIARPIAADVQCQAPKPILLATGRATFPNPWQPQIVPTQLFQIGNVMIAAVPGEYKHLGNKYFISESISL